METVYPFHQPHTANDAGWAHLLRESKDLAEKSAEAVPLHKALTRLYKKLNAALEEDPPPGVRRRLWYMARATLKRWIRREYVSEKVFHRKIVGTLRNEKGTSIHERITTVLATWAQQGLNSLAFRC